MLIGENIHADLKTCSRYSQWSKGLFTLLDDGFIHTADLKVYSRVLIKGLFTVLHLQYYGRKRFIHSCAEPKVSCNLERQQWFSDLDLIL